MSTERGTLEALLGELTGLLSPLTGLTPTGAPAFLAQLGLPVTEAQATQLASALGQVTSAIGRLVDLTFELETAIEAEDFGDIAVRAIEGIKAAAELVGNFSSLQSALGGLSLPDAGPILSALPQRLFNELLAAYLGRSPAVGELLQLTGILARTDHNALEPNKPFYTTNEFDFGRIGGWLSDPAAQLQGLYDWNTSGFDGTKLIAVLDRVAAEAGFPSLYDPSLYPARLDLVLARLEARTDVSPRGVEVTLMEGITPGTIERTGRHWTLAIDLDASVLPGTKVLIRPGSITVTPPESATLGGSATATYTYKRSEADPLKLLSISGGSRVTVEEVGASIGVDVKAGGEAELRMGAELKRGRILITTSESDGFIAKILGDLKIENTFDLGVGFSTEDGVYFHGSSALEIQLASHISLGPIELSALTLSMGIEDGTFPVGITTDIKASLGPLVAVVQGIGFELIFELAGGNSGNLGPIELGFGFVPPKGVGLSLDVGVVKGGGYLFFDFDREEYGGALELDIAGIVTAKAIGLITTRMPDGSKGFSLLIIITAEFGTPIQLGYGFTLNGVGGLLGLNRTVDLPTLRDGVRTGAVNSIMFPTNVVENAPQIINDLRQVFPPEEGVFLIGPMAKLGWGTPSLITLSFGLIIEIPGNIAILGVLRIALPNPDVPLVNIQVNFVGTLDFDKGMLTFDASLYDSFILFMTLEGDMAVRFKWSSPAGFLISVGGFHPSFQPPAELEVPSMKRLAINILDTDWARIRIEAYFALSSNSVQLGARVELYFGFDAFYVDGFLGFDALFRFSPFYFEFGIACGLTLHVFGFDLLSIHLQFALSGPSPWRALGTGSLTLLFFEIEVDFDVTWGDEANTTLPEITILPELLAKLEDVANWRALPPPSAGLWTTIRPLGPGETDLVLHPAGALSVSQRVAPLDFTWERIGHQRPADVQRASITGATSGQAELSVEPVSDQFARAQFENLTDAEKLSVPSFERMHAGATVGAGKDIGAGPGVGRTIEYEVSVIDKVPQAPGRFVLIPGLYDTFLAGGAVKRSPASLAHRRRLDPQGEKISVDDERHVVASTANNTAHGPQQGFASEAMAKQYMARQIAADPALADQLHVLPASEVNAA